MIIRHSLKILEQLSEIEAVIQTFETYAEMNSIDFDRETLIRKILRNREREMLPRQNDKN